MEVLFMFMFIFSFKLFSIVDSTVLVGAILFLCLIFNRKYRKKFIDFVFKNKKYIKGLIIIGSILFLWSILVVLINQTYDFSYLKTLVHLYCVIFVGIELCAFFMYRGKFNNIVNYIIIAFLIQSALQIIFFVFPDFSKLFNIFRSPTAVALSLQYHNFRGIALAGASFFSLASSYGIVFLLYVTKYNTLFKNKIIKFFMFVLLLLGTFFAGRTGFVSLIFIPFLLFKQIRNYFKNRGVKKIILDFSLGAIILLCFFGITFKVPRIRTLYNYSFELVLNLFNGKGLQTTSTNTLLEMYNVDINASNILIGDGMYNVCENGNCSYYQGTDVGYLRKILYFGIIGLVLSFVFQYYIFNKKIKNKENILLFIFLMILELKGETIGISIMVNSIIFLYTVYLENNSLNQKVTEKILPKKNENIEIDEKDAKVSIVIPAYNVEKYIEQTIDSMLNQTYKNIEIIVVDDGSTDKTKEILETKYNKSKKVKLIYQKNLGAPTARNAGFKQAKGKYIIFFDADDYMDLNYLENAMKIIGSSELLITPYRRIYNEDKTKIWSFESKEELSFKENLYLIPPFPGNKIYMKNIIEKNDIKFDDVKIAQDLNFYLKYLHYVDNVTLLDTPYVNYRILENSVSRTYNMKLLEVEKSISLAEEKINVDKSDSYLLKMVRIQHYSTQLLKLNNYSKDDGKKILKFFKDNVKRHKVFKLDDKYQLVMKKYLLYLFVILNVPYNIAIKLNKYIKRRLI